MKKEFKAKWIAALRSGEYKQTKGHLHDENGYCCLGVLCEVTQPEDWNGFHFDGYPNGEEFREFFGLNPREETVLIHMNDGFEQPQKPFSAIADWIEENL